MLIGGLLDCLLTIPVALVVMLCMLQDKRRPLWPVWAAVAPLVILMAWSVVRSYALMPWMQGYFLLASIGFMIYGVRGATVRPLAARQLCRPGAQGGVAEPAGIGGHHVPVRLLRDGLRQHHLRIHHSGERPLAHRSSAVARGDAGRPEHLTVSVVRNHLRCHL